jgi:hypothetical protein
VSADRIGRLARSLVPALVAVVLAVAMTWPLVLDLDGDVPQDTVDPLLTTWIVSWIGHALLEQPLDLFQANRLWPEEDSLAFTDALLGYAPAGLVAARGEGAAVVVYNLLFLFAYALAFLGAYLLAREIGVGRLAALAAGVAYAYAPYRLAQDGHLHVISSGGIPLALFLLIRGYRRRSWRYVLAGWLVTTWQVTLGFTLGVPLVYLLTAVGLVAAAIWLRRGRAALGAAVVRATAAGICILALVTFLQSRPYLRVADEHPEAERTFESVVLFSPPVRGFLAASQDSFVWSGPTGEAWDSLIVPGEQALFPGIAILVLAGLGLVNRAFSPALRFGLAGGTLMCALLSLGLRDEDHVTRGWTPYRLLYELGPGWDAFRASGRIHTLTTLGLALLASLGAALILHEVTTRRIVRQPFRTPASRGAAASMAIGLVVAVILVEGLGPTQHPAVARAPAGQLDAPGPQLHLPTDDVVDTQYAFWSIDGFPKIANGSASFAPAGLVRTRRIVQSFPDARSVAYLRELGVRTVILHPGLAAGTPWEGAETRPVDGLPLVREDRGDVVLYELEPGS